MPIFDFECKDCGKKFDIMLKISQKDEAKCPECGSSNLKQLLTSFYSPGTGGSSSSGGGSSSGCGPVT